MGKYDKYCVKNCGDSERHPMFDAPPIFVYGGEGFDEAPYHIEISYISKNGNFMPGTDKGEEKPVYGHCDGYYDGPYPRYNMKADRIMLFYGTNMSDIHELGAHVKFMMGDGIRDEIETFEFDDPRSILIPKRIRFGPITVTNLKTEIMVVDILTVPTVKEAVVRPDFTYYSEWHDQEQLGKNKKYKEQAEKFPRNGL